MYFLLQWISNKDVVYVVIAQSDVLTDILLCKVIVSTWVWKKLLFHRVKLHVLLQWVSYSTTVCVMITAHLWCDKSHYCTHSLCDEGTLMLWCTHSLCDDGTLMLWQEHSAVHTVCVTMTHWCCDRSQCCTHSLCDDGTLMSWCTHSLFDDGTLMLWCTHSLCDDSTLMMWQESVLYTQSVWRWDIDVVTGASAVHTVCVMMTHWCCDRSASVWWLYQPESQNV